ncbi:unnamed protein product [Hermetia illucens]|uniref:Uncharacterized protein n=2 Tax=Hermetia illucens TaxID=343691 RepID=A0A7R8YKY5_HERIL|nr:unnamed protein product [Hermetia illucens]
MLNPNSKERISMKELQKHAWIYGNQIAEFPSPDEDWKREIGSKISNFLEIPLYEVYSQILKAPYGPIGGIYNIEKLAHLIRKVKTINIIPRIDFKVLKGMSPKRASIRPLTYTSRDRIIQNPDNEGPKRRPTTAEGIQIQNELKATTNFQIKRETNLPIRRDLNHRIGDGRSPEMTTKERSTTSSKMLNFLNEKISKAFSIYSKRNNNYSEGEPRCTTDRSYMKPPQRPVIVPSLESVARKSADSNLTSIAGLSMHNDTGSENSSVKQTARTRFIKYLCSPKYQRQSAAMKKPRPCTAPNCYPPTKPWVQPISPKISRSAMPVPAEPALRPPVLSKYLNFNSVQPRKSNAPISPTTNSSRPSTYFSPSPGCSRNASFTASSRRRVTSGIPSHTAKRAAIRKELATRNNSQVKSKT